VPAAKVVPGVLERWQLAFCKRPIHCEAVVAAVCGFVKQLLWAVATGEQHDHCGCTIGSGKRAGCDVWLQKLCVSRVTGYASMCCCGRQLGR
jgi:hypothetical protein